MPDRQFLYQSSIVMTNKKIAFISLGPTCVAAEILKAGGLRTCTFGFDWLRSSYTMLNVFKNEP